MTTAAPTIVPLSKVKPSSSNPRKDLDTAAFEELKTSISEHGILSPLTVAANYEIIAGHRRHQAAKELGLPKVPVFVLEHLVGADDIAEAQLVEQLQRADLAPVDEAEAYAELVEKYQLDVAEIAARMAKSESYVRKRLQLASLCKAGRKALREGRINVGGALALARVPEKLQDAAVKETLRYHRHEGKGEIPAREVLHVVRGSYMTQMSEASFPIKDAELVPAAGPCSTCPKMTGNQPQLFDDVESKALCTDPVCWKAKTDAHWKREKAAHKAAGLPVIAAAEAKKIFWSNSWHDDLKSNSGYIAVDAKVDPYSYGAKDPTWKKVLGEHAPPVHLVRSPSGKTVRLFKLAECKAASKKHKIKLPKPRSGSMSGGKSPQQKAADKKRKLEEKIIKAAVAQVLAETRAKVCDPEAGLPPLSLLRYQLDELLLTERSDGALGSERYRELEALATAGDEVDGEYDHVVAGIAELVLGRAAHYSSWKPEFPKDLVRFADELGVDHKAILEAARAELTPAPKKKPAAKKGGKKTTTKKPAAKASAKKGAKKK